MQDSRTMRPRRQSRPSAPKRWRAVLAAILGITVLLALVNLIGLLEEPPAVKPPAGYGAVLLDIDAPMTIRRATFNYSVIPGGAFNGQELQRAVKHDAVVAQHYKDVNPFTMRPEILKADRLAYVSYRLGDRVYWTAKKVRIRSGETILTNGQAEIRARCGNCISMQPVLPTSADEPDPMQLDALTDTGHPMQLGALTDTAPVLVTWPLNAFGNLDAGGPVIVATAPLTMTQLGGPLYPFGAAAFPLRPIGEGPSDTEPKSSVPGDLPGSGLAVGVGTTPPGEVSPPLVAGPTVPGFSVDDPFALDRLDSLFDKPSTPLAPPTPAVNATPVPEPGTLLLLGGGLAALIARRWRSSRT